MPNSLASPGFAQPFVDPGGYPTTAFYKFIQSLTSTTTGLVASGDVTNGIAIARPPLDAPRPDQFDIMAIASPKPIIGDAILTFNASNSGAASPATYNGTVRVIISANSVGALALTGGTLTGELITVASATGTAGLNVPHGAAPTSPANGDLWTTTTGLFARINGATVGPFGTGTGNGSVTSVSVVTANGVSGSVATPTTTPAITITLGAITPSSVACSGAVTSSSATAGVGYASGSRGTVTQPTSKATGAASNTVVTDITLNSASLAASTTVSFVFTNSAIGANDGLLLNHVTTGTFGSYTLNAHGFASGSCTIDVRNVSLAALAEAIVIRAILIKGG